MPESQNQNLRNRFPRVLLLMPTTTYRTEAFIEAARRMNVEVTIGSEKPNTLARLNPTAFLTLDFHNPKKAARQVEEFSAQHPVDAIVPVDDEVTVVAATICKALSLRHNSVESVWAAKNKYTMRCLFQRAGVPSPNFKLGQLKDEAQEIASGVRYPCVVKPLVLAGSQGVIRADNEHEFVQAVDRLKNILFREADETNEAHVSAVEGGLQEDDHQPSGRYQYLIEDFIEGPEVALEGFLTHSKIRVLALFDKPDPMEGQFFEETIYLTPSQLPTSVQEQITECTQQAVHALGLSEGPIHAELRIGSEGPQMIEINARSIGGKCSAVLKFSTGITLEELIISHAVQESFEIPYVQHEPAGVMMIPVPRAGKLSEVRGLNEARNVPGIEKVVLSAHVGRELVPLPERSMYLGFIYAQAASTQAVETALREAHQHLDFVIESLDTATENHAEKNAATPSSSTV